METQLLQQQVFVQELIHVQLQMLKDVRPLLM
jgi:hypothetical protein